MTNMAAGEVVPDTQNAGHDPRYWCLPPQRDSPNVVVGEPNKGKYSFYLVTQGRVVGTWRNWTIAEAMILGYSGAAHRGHHTYDGCVIEWQQHCALGVHPHPADPAIGAGNGTGDRPAAPPKLALWKGKALDPELQAEMYEARCAFLAADEWGLEPQLLSTDDFMEAQDFSERIMR
ncbi:hypothetical protein C8J57DRAFT_1528761 [Mycena rebaudengoi]|nr:hypothetical protein C8J57DRAFT_1528761 [Mycena rebaudengoi]